jgi:hypothetical protein
MPPFGPDAGARNTLLSVEVQIVFDADVMSLNWVLEPLVFVNVPIASNETGPPFGTEVGTMVLIAAGRGVSVGVILGDLVGVADGAGVAGVGGGPFEIVMESSPKPGPVPVVVPLVLLPPVQLRRIAPKTNKTTGVTTSHLSHRDNIKPRAMTMQAHGVKLKRDSRTRFATM